MEVAAASFIGGGSGFGGRRKWIHSLEVSCHAVACRGSGGSSCVVALRDCGVAWCGVSCLGRSWRDVLWLGVLWLGVPCCVVIVSWLDRVMAGVACCGGAVPRGTVACRGMAWRAVAWLYCSVAWIGVTCCRVQCREMALEHRGVYWHEVS